MVPRLRVRIRHQEVAGISTVLFMAEDSNLWAPDLSGPAIPDATNTLSVPVSGSFSPTPASSEFGFGNVVSGTYDADFETVRIIRSSEPDTVLPALQALNVPTLEFPGYAVLAVLLAMSGWALLIRFRH